MNQSGQKAAAKAFVERWIGFSGTELEGCQKYWMDLLVSVLGLPASLPGIEFERRVRGRRIDVFYEDMRVLVEQKAPGLDLDKRYERGKDEAGDARSVTPYEQGKWYADNLPHSIRPRWVIVCNFTEIRVHDLDTAEPDKEFVSIKLEELPGKLALLSFITDSSKSRLVVEKELSIKAAELVGRLYDELSVQYLDLENSPREQRSLNVVIVRLVFLLYAEDAGLLQEHQAFLKYMKQFDAKHSKSALEDLFKMLNTPESERDPYDDPDLLAFPYVNGGLFADEDIIVPRFTEQLRVDLLAEASAGFDWSGISPTIFGAAFESTLNPETRRSGGMHYTSIENIHKVIDPLFLDDLKAELAKIEGEKVQKTREMKLKMFQRKLASINVLDPACGSGNFLTETYISLRKLENRVLEQLNGDQGALGFGIDQANTIMVNIGQLYGIEINDFAVSVAKTALWIAEAQAMDETQGIVYQVFDFLPLKSISGIVQGNALRMDWNDVLPSEKCAFVIGNPPFLGARLQNKEQKQEILDAFNGEKGSGNNDYVSGWYIKSAKYIGDNPIRCAYVSTNSICQGEQAPTVWKPVCDLGVHIDFAHNTFRWKNEATDQAHVFVVIVGFSKQNGPKRLFLHRTPDSEAEIIEASSINAYLHDAPEVYVTNRSKPISAPVPIVFGSMPNDGGGLLMKGDEKEAFVSRCPEAAAFIRPFIGASEYINNGNRWCIWLDGVPEDAYLGIEAVVKRIEEVRDYRLCSSRVATNKLAHTPHLFGEIRQPSTSYVVVPRHSSERRQYLPVGMVGSDVICGDANMLIPTDSKFVLGVMMSQFHNAWMRTVCGRIKSDYRYSSGVVYNNFIWPNATDVQKQSIEDCAQAILDARGCHQDKSLADLYDPEKMPADLIAAHKALDVAVEAAYGVDFQGDEEKIVAHLFKLYAEATADK